MRKATAEKQTTNGAAADIQAAGPYVLRVTLRGVCPLLFHAWNCESIAEKAGAAKGSTAKKTDNIESYVYRTTDGNLGIPGVNLHGSLINAARYMQDPRSPRKSAMDLVKAGIAPLTDVASFEPATDVWDYEDARRVTIQRAGVTRVRPAMREGWQATFDLLVNTPEYLPMSTVVEMVGNAGRLVGLCDFRPTYGRFLVVHAEQQ